MLNSKPETLNPKQAQSSKLKTFGFWVLDLFRVSSLVLRVLPCLIFVLTCTCFAKEDKQIISLTKQVLEAKSADLLYTPFEQVKDYFLAKNDFDGMCAFLKSLGAKKKSLLPFTDYYTAFARYQQLKFLEETQSWDEYFSKGNDYRDGITEGALKAITSTGPKEALRIRARLLLWQFHNGQQDNLASSALDELTADCLDYAEDGSDIKLLKYAADSLNSGGQAAKARSLYKVYAAKLIANAQNEAELLDTGEAFYKEGNLELAENLFDAFLDKLRPKAEYCALLKELIIKFAFKDGAPNDPQYAEKLFARLESLVGKDKLDEELIYLRAFNLEKAKEFKSAYDYYVQFSSRFPASPRSDEADYKAGLLGVYDRHDIDKGKVYFLKLAAKEKVSPQVIAAIYQLGLLSQWQGDAAKAGEYYKTVIDRSKSDFQDTVGLASLRLNEIHNSKAMEDNLKAFLDAALKGHGSLPDGQSVELQISPYLPVLSSEVSLSSQSNTSPSGCMQVQLQYLWSGHLGRQTSPPSGSSFATNFDNKGTKEVFLVVLSPTGAVGYALDICDVR